MARWTRYFLPAGIRRLWRTALSELKLFARVWLDVLLPNRLLRRRRLLRARGRKVHVGCGSRLFGGWLNVDMNRKGDLTTDLREGLPFHAGSVELIYTEHTLEHFYREHDGPFLLAECYRCLVPGGRIRITVPDAAAFIRYYVGTLEPEIAADLARTHARFHGTRMDVVNSGFRWKHQHLYMYDEETLRKLLEEIGFVEIVRQDYGTSSVEEFRGLDAEARRFGTLYLEASKPR